LLGGLGGGEELVDGVVVAPPPPGGGVVVSPPPPVVGGVGLELGGVVVGVVVGDNEVGGEEEIVGRVGETEAVD